MRALFIASCVLLACNGGSPPSDAGIVDAAVPVDETIEIDASAPIDFSRPPDQQPDHGICDGGVLITDLAGYDLEGCPPQGSSTFDPNFMPRCCPCRPADPFYGCAVKPAGDAGWQCSWNLIDCF